MAVLPFADLGGKPENQYFSDGLTEELIHALTKVPGMRVVAWNTAAQLRDRQQDVRSIREQLHVGTVLTGSVRIAGPSLRVRAQLIDTATGVYLWSETFDRPMQDVFAIQEEIARAIVRTLRVQLTGGEGALLARGRSNIGSYDYYLRGRYYWHRRTPEDLARSIEYFEAAIDADRNSALAHSGLADAHTLLVDYGLASPSIGMPKAKAAAARAIELDPALGEAYASLALIRSLYDWEWKEARCLYQRAIELNPGLRHRAPLAGRRLDGAHRPFRRSRRPDRNRPSIGPALQHHPRGQNVYQVPAGPLRRRGRRAIAASSRTIPTFYKGYTSLGRVYAQQGKLLDAIRMLEKGRSLAGDVPNILGAMGQVYALGGEPERAREILSQLEQRRQNSWVPATVFAIVHIGLGEYDKALDWLERGCRLHEVPITALKVHPVYNPLRAAPRFQTMLDHLRMA